jgi:hypothetical protein
VTFYNKATKKEEVSNVTETDQKYFETMLNKTPPKEINNLGKALTYKDQNPKILEDLWRKVKERGGFENSINFSSSKIVSATKKEEIQTIEESKDSQSLYTTVLKPKEVTESISDLEKTNIT